MCQNSAQKKCGIGLQYPYRSRSLNFCGPRGMVKNNIRIINVTKLCVNFCWKKFQLQGDTTAKKFMGKMWGGISILNTFIMDEILDSFEGVWLIKHISVYIKFLEIKDHQSINQFIAWHCTTWSSLSSSLANWPRSQSSSAKMHLAMNWPWCFCKKWLSSAKNIDTAR